MTSQQAADLYLIEHQRARREQKSREEYEAILNRVAEAIKQKETSK